MAPLYPQFADSHPTPHLSALPSTRRSEPFFCRLALVLGLAGAVFYFIRPFAISLLAGLIFAMVLAPAWERWQTHSHHTHGRAHAAALTLAFAFAFLLPAGAAVYFGTQEMIQHIGALEQTNDPSAALVRGDAASAVKHWIDQNPAVGQWIQQLPVAESRILKLSNEWGGRLLQSALSLSQNILSSVPSALFGALIILVTIYFILADGVRGRTFIEHNPVFSETCTREVMRTFRDTSFYVVVASVISGLIQAAILAAGAIVTGKGSPLLVGLFTFVSSFLPLVGTGPVTLVLTLSQLIAGHYSAALVFSGFGFAASMADNIVVPKIVGDRVQVHPLIVLVAACGGVQTMGVYGVFIGPVVASTFLKVLTLLNRKPTEGALLETPLSA